MSGPALKKDPNGFYYVYWTEGRRSKRVSTRSRNLEEAKGFLATWLNLEPIAAEAVEALTVGAVWTRYTLKHVEAKVVDKARLANAWKSLEPHFAHLPVKSVTQDHVDDYVAKRTSGRLGRKVIPATVRRELNAMRGSWGYLVKTKELTEGDIPHLEFPEGSPPRDRWLTLAEIEKLLATAKTLRVGKGTSRTGTDERLSRCERFIWLALHTAARRRAIETLKWSQVDFETRVIHYNPAGRNQTKKKRASVPISDDLLPILETAFKERRGEFVLDHAGAIRKTFETCAFHAGMSDLTRHDLRHTAATHMARRGIPLWIIAGVLGNSVEMVVKVYAKHSPDALRDAVNVFSTPKPKKESDE